ncbi:MAG: hypothetical protein JSS66_00730 [Armatimonadetes bacterium]|nr:hypothetical protein [Armatimonadota bacterium]
MAHFLALIFTTLGLTLGPQADDLKFYQEVASIAPLQSKAVQQELVITEAQRGNLNKHADKYNAETQTLLQQKQKGEISAEDFTKRLATAQADMQAGALSELTKGQVIRLGQITLQMKGVPALLTVAVGNKLGLTEAQKKALAAGWNETGKALAELEREVKEPIVKKYSAMDPKTDEEKAKLQSAMKQEIQAADDKIKPDILKLKKAFEGTVDKTLTESQKKLWTELKGPAFKPS